MSFLTPLTGLLAAAITIPILLGLYFLKLKRRQLSVPTTLLWQTAAKDLEANTPFQKMRNRLLMWLQLLLLAALLFAMARPVGEDAEIAGQRLVVLIDHSASMSATDVPGGRLAEAVKRAEKLVDGAEGAPVMLVAFADRARVLSDFTTDRARLRLALSQITPTDGGSNLAAALDLIRDEARMIQNDPAQLDGASGLRVVVVSDGRVVDPSSAAERLTLPGADLVYESVAAADSGDRLNAGIVAFSARRDLRQPELVQVYGRLINSSVDPLDVTASLLLDDTLVRTFALTLPPVSAVPVEAEDGSLSFVPPVSVEITYEFEQSGAGLLELRLRPDDALRADNRQRLVLAPALPLRILIVTPDEGPVAVGAVAAAMTAYGVEAIETMPISIYAVTDPMDLPRAGWRQTGGSSGTGPDEPGFDLIVFDNVAPPTVPPVDSIYFGVVPPLPNLAHVAAREGDNRLLPILEQHPDHPLMRYAVMDEVLFYRPGRLALPADATILATAPNGPVIAELIRGSTRHVMVATSLRELNEAWQWQHGLSFVVFLHNLLDTCGFGGAIASGSGADLGVSAGLADAAGLSYEVGDVAILPATLADTVFDGPVELTARVAGARSALPAFTRSGLYDAQGGNAQPPWDRLAVNLLSDLESDLRPASVLEIGTTAVSANGSAAGGADRRELWRWFLWAALAILLLEWLVYARRMRV